MKNKFLIVSCMIALLSGCAATDKVSDQAVLAEDGTYGWNDDVEMISLSETDLSKKFENNNTPIVHFAFNEYKLSAEAKEILKEQAVWLHEHPKALVLIEGHADERGTREYNLALGERRAGSVVTYLISNGVKANRIRLISYGKERPMVSGSNEKAWSQNRRAVTRIQ